MGDSTAPATAAPGSGQHHVRMLSVGLPSTLGSYLTLSKHVFGGDSPACKFIEDKIAESPHGVDEEVIADETQVIQLLLHAHKNGYERATDVSAE